MRKTFFAIGLALAGCTASYATTQDDQRDAIAKFMAQLDFGRPYLAEPLADPSLLAPPPPAEDSHGMAIDHERNQAALALRDTDRWKLAASDADLRKDAVLSSFSCAAGIALSDEATPATAHLLRRSRSDFGASTSPVKKQYQRPRPFMINGESSCTPEAEAFLSHDGSYPSGHSAIGYGTGLVLAALIPERASQLVARGVAYGESRAMCNVHWSSDVAASRPIASAVFARLVANPQFAEDFAAAQAELAALERSDSTASPARCTWEARALASK